MPKSVTATGSAPGRYEYGYGAGLLMNNVKLVSGSTTLDTPITRDDDGLVTGLGTFTFTRTNNDANLRIAESSFTEDMAFDGQRRLATRTGKGGAQGAEEHRPEL